MQKQQATASPQKNQESTHRPNRMPSPKQSRQQLCSSLLRHIKIPPMKKAAEFFSAAFVLWYILCTEAEF